MKKMPVMFVVLLILLMVSACSGSQSSDSGSQVPPHRNPVLYEKNLTPSAQEYLSHLTNATVYEAEIEIDASYSSLQGELKAYWINNEDVPLSEIYFRLFPNYNGGTYQINNVLVGEEEAPWEFESDMTALRVDLPEPLPVGEEQLISIAFSLTIPDGMGGNYDIFGSQNQILALDNFLPVIPVYNTLGWHIDYPATKGDLPFVDASFHHVKITAPEELVIAASGSGEVIAQDLEAGQQTTEIFAGPVRDFYISASPLYSVESLQVGETTVNSYALPGFEARQELALEVGRDALNVFGEHFGTYPYAEYDIAASPVLTAMEYPGVIAVGLDKYHEDDGSSDLPLGVLFESAIVHETAHQWFYNMIGDDQVNEPWLDESFAMYLTHLYYADITGSAAGYDISIGNSWSRVERAPIPIGMPVTEYSRAEYSPIVYARGLFFLLELEYEMGEEAFAAALIDYFDANIWQIVTSETFKQAMESGCNCDLSDLWQEWVVPES